MKKRTLRILALVFAILSVKSLPFAYYVRFLYTVVKGLWIDKAPSNKDPYELFKTVSYTTYCSLLECDFYLHKSNSTYLLDLDMARTTVMVNRLNLLFWGLKRKFGLFPMIPVGSIACHFKKEIKPLQRYEIHGQVFAWDDKWLFLLCRFMIGDKLCCSSISKMVWKNGRQTLAPKDFLEIAGLYNEKVALVNERRMELMKHYVNEAELIEKLILEVETFKPKL